MKKLYTLALALVAVVAFSAIAVASASAEELLAEWLVGGVGVTTLTSVVGLGELVLKDTKVGLGMVCSGELVGSVGPNGEVETTEAVTLTGAASNLTAGNLLKCKASGGCEEGTDLEAAAENLPWHGLLTLMSETGAYLVLQESPAYYSRCLVIGLNTEEECSVTDTTYEVLNLATDVEAMGKTEPNANCTVGGTGAGAQEFVAGNLLETLTGASIQVSSE